MFDRVYDTAHKFRTACRVDVDQLNDGRPSATYVLADVFLLNHHPHVHAIYMSVLSGLNIDHQHESYSTHKGTWLKSTVK
jgi:hypothetical protein